MVRPKHFQHPLSSVLQTSIISTKMCFFLKKKFCCWIPTLNSTHVSVVPDLRLSSAVARVYERLFGGRDKPSWATHPKPFCYSIANRFLGSDDGIAVQGGWVGVGDMRPMQRYAAISDGARRRPSTVSDCYWDTQKPLSAFKSFLTDVFTATQKIEHDEVNQLLWKVSCW